MKVARTVLRGEGLWQQALPTLQCVSVATCRAGGLHVMAEMMDRLADAPPQAGAVACLGFRLDGFAAAAWEEAYRFLAASAAPEELERAGRYLRREDGVRHLLGRALLRRALGNWSGRTPPSVWPANAWGKPAAWAGVHFNISHAGGDVWLAFCRSGEVGIDVEDAVPAREDLAPWLHPAERAGPPGLGDPLARRRLWARKEALVKATGLGLSLPLGDFRVAADRRPADWLLQAPPAFPGPWSTFDVPAPGASAIAVAVGSRDVALSWRLACLRWEA